jgi:group I intron endonuclease
LSSKGIYKIINKVNGKYYIGMTDVSFKKRMKRHLPALRNNRHTNKHLQGSFTKYGETNFIFECFIDMTHFSKEEILAKEESLILENYESGLLYNRSVNCLLIRKNEEGQYVKKTVTPGWPVIQLDSNNNFVAKYNTSYEAAKHTEYSKTAIAYAAKHKTECAGKHNWIYEKDYVLNKDNISLTPMKIRKRKDSSVCLINDGQIIEIFKSRRFASKQTGSSEQKISMCINNELEVCNKGYVWKYLEDIE